MIGYSISLEDLKSKIEEQYPGWLAKAEQRTARFREMGCYKENSSIWSEVKPLYMKLQGECKCAYCERKFESVDYGLIEQDTEHFRPKKDIVTWAVPENLRDIGIEPSPVPQNTKGYYLLAYHPFNYAASCKPCNTSLKRNYFPIEGEYDLTGDDPEKLLSERPYLIYPVGDFDDDPSELIQFHGLSPFAVSQDEFGRARALVMIEFFGLDDAIRRKNLFRERACIVIALFPQLEKLFSPAKFFDDEVVEAGKIVNAYTSENAPHTNCARSFKRLFESERQEAREIFEKAVLFISGIS